MSDKKCKLILMRRRFCKRVILAVLAFGLSFYVSILLFGNLKTPRVMNLTDLGRCPACYGVSVCPELYSNQVTLETEQGWASLFNAKNIYYGYTKYNRRAVLKKLAHNWELKELDTEFCKIWGLKKDCNPLHTVHNISNINDKIINIVHYNLTNPGMEPRKRLVMCPYAYSFYDLVQPVLNANTNKKFDMMYIWTMLMVNPEPIILQVIPKSKGWPVPAYGGVCGRLELVAYEGEPLSSLMHVEWSTKLKFAYQILDAAMDFTFKHDRFRFYLLDWSIDNLVANENDDITFVDLEDVVILDKHISPHADLPHWYKRYKRENHPGFTFSIDKMCHHHLSDHNIWAACYVLAGDENPLLYPIPKEVNDTRPHLDRLLHECLYGEDRFRSIIKLQHVIDDILTDYNIIGYKAINR